MTNTAMNRTMTLGTLVLGVLAAGCASSGVGGSGAGGTSPMTASQALKPLVGAWSLAALNGRDGSSLTGMNGQRPSISIDPEGRIAGYGGVNRIGGGLDLEALGKGEFMTGPMFSTKMAGPPEAMSLEDEFTRALSNANRFMFEGERLVLLGKGTRVEFVR